MKAIIAYFTIFDITYWQMMNKWFLTSVIPFFIVFSGYSQQWKLKRIEGILGIGTTNVYGDLGGAPNATNILFIKDITFRGTRPSIYGGLRYRHSRNGTIKASLIYGYSMTEDFDGSRNENRGFSSSTQLLELAGTYEYYFLPEQRRLRSAAMFNRRGMINDYSSIGAYAFAGLGATMYWPDFELSEERPGDKYKYNLGITAAVPVGLGIKYIISDKWILGYEVGYRMTISDFLDGFESPSSKRFDTYWISSINLSYRMITTRRGIPIWLDRFWYRNRQRRRFGRY